MFEFPVNIRVGIIALVKRAIDTKADKYRAHPIYRLRKESIENVINTLNTIYNQIRTSPDDLSLLLMLAYNLRPQLQQRSNRKKYLVAGKKVRNSGTWQTIVTDLKNSLKDQPGFRSIESIGVLATEEDPYNEKLIRKLIELAAAGIKREEEVKTENDTLLETVRKDKESIKATWDNYNALYSHYQTICLYFALPFSIHPEKLDQPLLTAQQLSTHLQAIEQESPPVIEEDEAQRINESQRKVASDTLETIRQLIRAAIQSYPGLAKDKNSSLGDLVNGLGLQTTFKDMRSILTSCIEHIKKLRSDYKAPMLDAFARDLDLYYQRRQEYQHYLLQQARHAHQANPPISQAEQHDSAVALTQLQNTLAELNKQLSTAIGPYHEKFSEEISCHISQIEELGKKLEKDFGIKPPSDWHSHITQHIAQLDKLPQLAQHLPGGKYINIGSYKQQCLHRLRTLVAVLKEVRTTQMFQEMENKALNNQIETLSDNVPESDLNIGYITKVMELAQRVHQLAQELEVKRKDNSAGESAAATTDVPPASNSLPSSTAGDTSQRPPVEELTAAQPQQTSATLLMITLEPPAAKVSEDTKPATDDTQPKRDAEVTTTAQDSPSSVTAANGNTSPVIPAATPPSPVLRSMPSPSAATTMNGVSSPSAATTATNGTKATTAALDLLTTTVPHPALGNNGDTPKQKPKKKGKNKNKDKSKGKNKGNANKVTASNNGAISTADNTPAQTSNSDPLFAAATGENGSSPSVKKVSPHRKVQLATFENDRLSEQNERQEQTASPAAAANPSPVSSRSFSSPAGKQNGTHSQQSAPVTSFGTSSPLGHHRSLSDLNVQRYSKLLDDTLKSAPTKQQQEEESKATVDQNPHSAGNIFITVFAAFKHQVPLQSNTTTYQRALLACALFSGAIWIHNNHAKTETINPQEIIDLANKLLINPGESVNNIIGIGISGRFGLGLGLGSDNLHQTALRQALCSQPEAGSIKPDAPTSVYTRYKEFFDVSWANQTQLLVTSQTPASPQPQRTPPGMQHTRTTGESQ